MESIDDTGCVCRMEPIWETMEDLERENMRLKEREKIVPTVDEAQKFALIRALQEIRDAVGLLGDGVSPREIVEAAAKLEHENKVLSRKLEFAMRTLQKIQHVSFDGCRSDCLICGEVNEIASRYFDRPTGEAKT